MRNERTEAAKFIAWNDGFVAAKSGQLLNSNGGAVLYTGENGLEVFVSDYCNHRISVFDSSTGAFLRHMGVGQLKGPWGLALSLTGVASQGGDYLLYACDNGNHRVQTFNARTGAHIGFLGEVLLNGPYGLKIHAGSEGKSLLFVTDCGNKKIEVLEL